MQNNNSYTETDFYSSYILQVSDSPNYLVDSKTFKSILKDYFTNLSSMIIDDALEVKLPAGLGNLLVKKSIPKSFDKKNLRIDFFETKINHKTIYHLNEHSMGYNYIFKWEKSTIGLGSKSMYELRMSRTNKRRLAFNIKNNITDYIRK